MYDRSEKRATIGFAMIVCYVKLSELLETINFLSLRFRVGRNLSVTFALEVYLSFFCRRRRRRVNLSFCSPQIAKHLPNSSAIICGSVDRDVYKERVS